MPTYDLTATQWKQAWELIEADMNRRYGELCVYVDEMEARQAFLGAVAEVWGILTLVSDSAPEGAPHAENHPWPWEDLMAAAGKLAVIASARQDVGYGGTDER